MDSEYRNVAVEAEIAQALGLDAAGALEVFRDLLRFLDGCWLARDLRSPTPAVDVAWHIFLVHTRAYTAYSTARFGTYLHHEPDENVGDPALAQCSANVRSPDEVAVRRLVLVG